MRTDPFGRKIYVAKVLNFVSKAMLEQEGTHLADVIHRHRTFEKFFGSCRGCVALASFDTTIPIAYFQSSTVPEGLRPPIGHCFERMTPLPYTRQEPKLGNGTSFRAHLQPHDKLFSLVAGSERGFALGQDATT